jgi:hypothetical protein
MKNINNKYEKLEDKSSEEFKRLVGVKRDTFNLMLETYEEYHNKKKSKGGADNKLSPANQILLMLEYYTDYRSMKKMELDWGVSDTSISRIIKEVESQLITKFTLPSKRALSDLNIEYIVIDVTECEIERPKKNKKDTIQERKRDIP